MVKHETHPMSFPIDLDAEIRARRKPLATNLPDGFTMNPKGYAEHEPPLWVVELAKHRRSL